MAKRTLKNARGLDKLMHTRNTSAPQSENDAPSVTGGSYAGIVQRLHHPHGPDFEMVAKGIALLLSTNHYDAAMIVTHTLADLMDDFCLRQQGGRD